MKGAHFDHLVEEAIAGLPERFRAVMENIAIVVQDEPTLDQLDEAGLDEDDLLLGLYQGIPLTGRSANYGMVAPDVIYIFQMPIEEICATDDEIRMQIQATVKHEIAHYFGISDERLGELGVG